MANARVRTIRAYSAFVAANFARCSSSSRSTGGHDAAFALNVSALVDSVFQPWVYPQFGQCCGGE